MIRTFKSKIRINKKTEANCLHWLAMCRTLYNLALEQRIILWKQSRKSMSYYDQAYQLSEFKREFPDFKFIDAQCLRDSVFRLDKAYQGFFRGIKNGEKVGFPRFKSKSRYDSFTLYQNSWKLEGKYLIVRNLGRFKLFLSRPIEGTIKTITIKRTPTNKWFVSFSCNNILNNGYPKTDKEVGIDVGIKNFCVDSEGKVIGNPKYYENSLKVLLRRQRALSRKKKGAQNREDAKLLVAKTHEKITNQRKDFLHKTANYYIENYQTIYIENLNIKNMIKNKYLSRNIADSSWGMFFDFLSYKAEGADREVIKVKPQGTSQICSGCNEKVPKSLSVRIHKCPNCGLILDRDLNAAINIKTFGQKVQMLNSICCLSENYRSK